MRRIITKHPLDGVDHGASWTINTGALPRMLHIGDQRGTICAWIESDPQAEGEVHLVARGTGIEFEFQSVATDGAFVQTLQSGPWVWHFYQRT